ncbi:MAG: sulfate/molybdate ABC transporter ATP-binding protein [Lachnospiraceae bacterium]
MSLEVKIEKQLKDMLLKVEFQEKDQDGILGILGASGSGKSMTLKCIAGIEVPDRGRIVLNGRVLFDSEQKISMRVQDRRVGYLFQNYALFPHMTVQQNIMAALPGSREERQKTAERYMKLLRIEELADSRPSRLSGGQQQRAALARVLASKPEVLMLDEPFSALDYFLKESLQLELLDLLKEYPGEVLMVSHSRDEIYRFCKHICVLDQGQMVVKGETKAVFEKPDVVAAARLTGCKNIAGMIRISDRQVSVPQWGNCVLEFQEAVPDWVTHLGLRAHDLRKVTGTNEKNQIRCSSVRLIEDMFEVTVIVNDSLWWKVPKDAWRDEYGCQVPETLVLPEECILYLHE